jgi:uncharacterized protein YbaA (DUF1428 family)
MLGSTTKQRRKPIHGPSAHSGATRHVTNAVPRSTHRVNRSATSMSGVPGLSRVTSGCLIASRLHQVSGRLPHRSNSLSQGERGMSVSRATSSLNGSFCDVPKRKVTDFWRAVDAKDDETIVFSWIEWLSKKARDEAWPKLMADPRMQPNKDNMPFDGKRMIYGGFATILDA